MNARPIFNFILAICIFEITGCTTSDRWEDDSKVLLEECHRLSREHEQLDAQIDSLWDATTEALSQAIPEDFPPTDREVFLKARNADHIRMFMSFKNLPAETQSLVNKAGEYDQQLALKVGELQKKQFAFEQKKIDFLRTVSREDIHAGQHYADLLRDAYRNQAK